MIIKVKEGQNMELLDVLDENGNKTGEVEDRSEIYRRRLPFWRKRTRRGYEKRAITICNNYAQF